MRCSTSHLFVAYQSFVSYQGQLDTTESIKAARARQKKKSWKKNLSSVKLRQTIVLMSSVDSVWKNLRVQSSFVLEILISQRRLGASYKYLSSSLIRLRYVSIYFRNSSKLQSTSRFKVVKKWIQRAIKKMEKFLTKLAVLLLSLSSGEWMHPTDFSANAHSAQIMWALNTPLISNRSRHWQWFASKIKRESTKTGPRWCWTELGVQLIAPTPSRVLVNH